MLPKRTKNPPVRSPRGVDSSPTRGPFFPPASWDRAWPRRPSGRCWRRAAGASPPRRAGRADAGTGGVWVWTTRGAAFFRRSLMMRRWTRPTSLLLSDAPSASPIQISWEHDLPGGSRPRWREGVSRDRSRGREDHRHKGPIEKLTQSGANPSRNRLASATRWAHAAAAGRRSIEYAPAEAGVEISVRTISLT